MEHARIVLFAALLVGVRGETCVLSVRVLLPLFSLVHFFNVNFVYFPRIFQGCEGTISSTGHLWPTAFGWNPVSIGFFNFKEHRGVCKISCPETPDPMWGYIQTCPDTYGAASDSNDCDEMASTASCDNCTGTYTPYPHEIAVGDSCSALHSVHTAEMFGPAGTCAATCGAMAEQLGNPALTGCVGCTGTCTGSPVFAKCKARKTHFTAAGLLTPNCATRSY